MSGPLVSKALAAALPGPVKLTLVALASHARADGTHCWPGKALLAAEVGRDARTVQRHLKQLANWGFISLLSDPRRGRGRRDEYLIQIEKGDASVSLPADKGRHQCRKRETPVSLKGDSGVATYKERTVNNRQEPLCIAEFQKIVAPTNSAATAWKPPDWYLIIFNARKNWTVASPREFVDRMEAKYPAGVLLHEAQQAADWCEGHPRKGKTKNILKLFFGRWVHRNARNQPDALRPDAGRYIGTITRPQVKI